ncbi:MAG: hypothetical protein KDC98_25665, partial [Planctomycetes bacterium]|nr:hypothetical protein [Planctomycetota bacterium]
MALPCRSLSITLLAAASLSAQTLPQLVNRARAAVPDHDLAALAAMCGVPEAPSGRVRRLDGQDPEKLSAEQLLQTVYERIGKLRIECEPAAGEGGASARYWQRPKNVWPRLVLELHRATADPRATSKAIWNVDRRDARRTIASWLGSAGQRFADLRTDATRLGSDRHSVATNFLGTGRNADLQRLERIDGIWTLRTCLMRDPGGETIDLGQIVTATLPWFAIAREGERPSWAIYYDGGNALLRPIRAPETTALVRYRHTRPGDPLGAPGEARVWFEVAGFGSDGDELLAMSGDCENGTGVAFDAARLAVYDGAFVAGRFEGAGRLVALRDGTTLIARFVAGQPHGPAIELLPFPGMLEDIPRDRVTARRVLFERGAVTESVPLQHGYADTPKHRTLDNYEFGFWDARRGRVVEGDSAGGLCTVEFDDLGTVIGPFVDHLASGELLLTTPEGDRKVYECMAGAPALVRCLTVTGEERRRHHAAHPEDFPIGDCLRGDTRGGVATKILGEQSLYVGAFENGVPHGDGVIQGTSSGRSRLTGSFVEGKREGRFELSLMDGAVQCCYIDYRNDEEVGRAPIPGAPVVFDQPRSESVQLPDIVIACSDCSGLGSVYSKTYQVDEVVLTPFMPGDRNAGSWLWRGYAHRTGRTITQGGDRVTCAMCRGLGSIRRPGGKVPRSWFDR